jgi:hypothetical protein
VPTVRVYVDGFERRVKLVLPLSTRMITVKIILEDAIGYDLHARTRIWRYELTDYRFGCRQPMHDWRFFLDGMALYDSDTLAHRGFESGDYINARMQTISSGL